MKQSPLLAALDAESYEYLVQAAPGIAEAVESEVLAGRTPEQIRRMVLQHVGSERAALAERCCQAARFLARGTA